MSVSVLQIFFIKSLLTLPSSILFPYTTLFRSISENKKRKRIDNAIIRCVFLMFSLLSPALLGNYSDRSITKASYRERSEEHTSELQSRENLVCRLLLEKKKVIADKSLITVLEI